MPGQYLLRNRKAIYNEMVELWGSLVEAVSFRIRGKLPENDPKDNSTVKSIKSFLLFQKSVYSH